jgi:hypothetical protein
MKKNTKRLIAAELFVSVISLIAILFKYYNPDNVFFPKIGLMIVLYIIGSLFLGLGIVLEKF